MATLVDSYEGSSPFTATILNAANDWNGEYWTTSEAYDIESVELYMSKSGDVGIIEVELYAADGAHKPTGSILASGTVANADISGTPSWISCTFGSTYSLSNAVEYCLVIHGDSLDGSNVLYMNSDDTGYANAARLFSVNGGSSWNVISANDALFRTYKQSASYQDITASITATTSLSGTLDVTTYKNLTADITATSILTATLTVASNWLTTNIASVKRIIAAGNDKIFYEDI